MTPYGREGWGDVFFDRLWPEWHRDVGEEWLPSMDFSDKDGKYVLHAELPGMSKEDISVTVEDGYLTVSGKKESDNEEKGADYYMRETRCGSFSRSFRLPGKVDDSAVDAEYKDGVLTVVMPHGEDTERKKIDIN